MNNLHKVLFLSFVHFLISTSVKGQREWAPIGAKWTMEERFAFAGNLGFIEIEVIGDTIINGQSARILQRSSLSCNLRPLLEFTYQDQGRVYLYDIRNEAFNLTFDFGVGVDSSYVMYRMNPLDRDALEAVTVTVDSISFYALTDGDSLRVQHVSTPTGFASNIPTTILLENIGFNTGLTPALDALCDGNFENRLRCYEDVHLGKLSFLNVDCQFTNTQESVAQVHKLIKLSPIPATNILHITVLKDHPVELEIFDSSGRILIHRKNVFAKTALPIERLSAGLYFIRVWDEGQVQQVEKWVKW